LGITTFLGAHVVAQHSTGVTITPETVPAGAPPRFRIKAKFFAPFNDIHFITDNGSPINVIVNLDLDITNLSDTVWDSILLSFINGQLPNPTELATETGPGATAGSHPFYSHFHPCLGAPPLVNGSITNRQAFQSCFPQAAGFELYDPTGMLHLRLDAGVKNGPPADILVHQKLRPNNTYHFTGLHVHVIGPTPPIAAYPGSNSDTILRFSPNRQ